MASALNVFSDDSIDSYIDYGGTDDGLVNSYNSLGYKESQSGIAVKDPNNLSAELEINVAQQVLGLTDAEAADLQYKLEESKADYNAAHLAYTEAKANGDDTTAMEKAYKEFSENPNLVNMRNLRVHVSKYHPVPREANTIWSGVASPYMGLNDLRWFIKQLGSFEDFINLNQHLFDYIMVADVREYGLEYQVPVGFISGSEDWITPVKYSEDYYNAVSAPKKDIALIDGCGHSPHYDSPKEFCDELKGMLEKFLH